MVHLKIYVHLSANFFKLLILRYRTSLHAWSCACVYIHTSYSKLDKGILWLLKDDLFLNPCLAQSFFQHCRRFDAACMLGVHREDFSKAVLWKELQKTNMTSCLQSSCLQSWICTKHWSKCGFLFVFNEGLAVVAQQIECLAWKSWHWAKQHCVFGVS